MTGGEAGRPSWCTRNSSSLAYGLGTLVPHSYLLRHVYSSAAAETVGSSITGEVIASHDLRQSGMVAA
jgi:hypothetical protein